MKQYKTILKWFFGIFFLLGGIAGLLDNVLVGITSMLIGLFILPPSIKAIEQKIKYTFTSAIKWTVAISGLLIMGIAISKQNEKQDKEVDKIVERAIEEIDKGNIDSALVYIEQAKELYSNRSKNKALALENDLNLSNSEEYAKEILANMTDSEFTQLQTGKLNKQYINQKTLNKNFYILLNKLSPYRQQILEEIRAEKEMQKIAEERDSERKRQTETENERKKKIEKQFSSWDGSHPALSRMIKQNCRNPKSYEHIETRYRDDGNSIFVTTKYRAENGFGGMTIGIVSARVDFEGNVIEIISQQ